MPGHQHCSTVFNGEVSFMLSCIFHQRKIIANWNFERFWTIDDILSYQTCLWNHRHIWISLVLVVNHLKCDNSYNTLLSTIKVDDTNLVVLIKNQIPFYHATHLNPNTGNPNGLYQFLHASLIWCVEMTGDLYVTTATKTSHKCWIFFRFVDVKNTEILSSKMTYHMSFCSVLLMKCQYTSWKFLCFLLYLFATCLLGCISKCVGQLLWQWVTYMWPGPTKLIRVLAKYFFQIC